MAKDFTIWKFPLQVTDSQEITVPLDYTLLSVQVQNIDGEEVPCIWAVVDPNQTKIRLTIHTIGTGGPCTYVLGMPFLGTYQLRGGALVFHVFVGRTR